tara:strand:+ start:219 stop:404 length:186 start_codon:yes stop_codon:yes gene_type:complete
MSKRKQLDDIAQGVAEVTLELMNDSVDWQIGDFNLDGDDYEDLHEYVLTLAIKKMYLQNQK